MTQTTMDVLAAVKSGEIAALVKSLNVDQVDALMKYLYCGMATPEKFNSAVLLQWHEKAFESGGVGSIVRVLTDRRVL